MKKQDDQGYANKDIYERRSKEMKTKDKGALWDRAAVGGQAIFTP